MFIPVDCHAHTTMSDGQLDVADLVEVARRRGVRPSVSDHISRDVAGSLKSIEAVREYLDALDAHDVLRGGEFCWHDSLWRELPDDIVPRFTHRLGSLHAVRLDDGSFAHAFDRRPPAGLSADVYMRGHLESVRALAAEMPVDVMAHPTLVAIALRSIPAEELWTEEHEEGLVDALAAGGIAFEISNRYKPHERVVRRAIDRGLRLALGSDGHTADQVANVEWPLALARRLGVNDEDLYDPTRHGSRTVRA